MPPPVVAPPSLCAARLRANMEIDFDANDPVSDFVTVPAGTYENTTLEL